MIQPTVYQEINIVAIDVYQGKCQLQLFFSYFSLTFATTNYLKEDKFKPI